MVQQLNRLLRRWRASDPYWDGFVNRPLADPRNLVLDMVARSRGGGVWAVKMDVHDPAAMCGHMQQLAEFWGADLFGVAATDAAWLQLDDVKERQDQADGLADVADAQALAKQYPHTLVCAVRRSYDETAAGMGARYAEQKLAVANFNLRSYIREVGYGAIFARPAAAAEVAASAGVGTLEKGRLVTRKYGSRVVLGDVLLTDLPLQPRSERR